jgi:hypothetical protein
LLARDHFIYAFLTKIFIVEFESAVDISETLILKIICNEISVVLAHAFKVAFWVGNNGTEFRLRWAYIGLVGGNTKL